MALMRIHSTLDLGKQIREIRKRKALTRKELTQACRCGTRFISDLENGKPTVEFGLVLRVANTLSFDLAVMDRQT